MGKKPVQQQNTYMQAAPIPEPAPPVKNTAQEVVQAGMDLRQQEAMKKGLKKTTIAGETGGWRNAPNAAYGMPSAPSVKVP